MQNDFPNVSQSQLKKWSRLDEAKFRREEGLFLAEGIKVVEELLKSDWRIEAILVLPEKMRFWGNLVGPFHDKHPIYQLTRAQWKKMSQDKEPEGLMAVVRRKDLLLSPEWIRSAAGNLLVLHEVSNPQNLGALVRSACWFGFAGVVLIGNCVDWTHPKAIRASMGGVFHIPVVAGPDVQNSLLEIRKEYLLIGSDAREGAAPHPPSQKAALLLGSESHGLPDDILKLVDERWRIPGGKSAESLSLPQAAAIMMYETIKNAAIGQS